MEITSCIKKDGPRQLHSLVSRGAGRPVATSATSDTVGKLESGLALLLEAARSLGCVVVKPDAKVTIPGSAARRLQFRFRGHLDADRVSELFRGAKAATLIDERPDGQIRTDLYGRLCELGY